MTYTFQLLATLLTIYTYGYTHKSICLHTSTHLYIYINYAHAYVHLFSYFYTSYIYPFERLRVAKMAGVLN